VDTDRDLLRVAQGYLDQGRRDGDLIVLACPTATRDLIQEDLGAADGLQLESSPTEWGLRPPDLFARWRRYAEQSAEHRSGRLRVLAQPLLPTDAERLREHVRTEAVTTQVLAELPMNVLCLYDTRHVPPAVVGDAESTHPQLVGPAGWVDSPRYQSAAEFVRRLPLVPFPMESGPPVFAADDVPTLPDLRHRLGAVLEALVPDEELRGDLHLALSEVAANAFRHGRRPVSARIWAGPARIVCTITDGGHSFDDPLAGFVPAHGYDLSRGGMGLWLARKLWDHVDLFAGPDGFTVRLSTALPGPDPA
jgi:anti-sigma regulatory factor (Ser/Thr protein kinase)